MRMQSTMSPTTRIVCAGTQVIHELVLGDGTTTEEQSATTIGAFASALAKEAGARREWSLGLGPTGLVCRDVYARNGVFVFLLETTPGLRTMQWVREDSPKPFGEGATYRDVQVALPWQYFFIAIDSNGCVLWRNSVYFRRTPLGSLRDELLEPHFFNCSVNSHGAWCWICIPSSARTRKTGESPLACASSFIDEFWHSGFNWSSEFHEPEHGGSFWNRNRERIQDSRVRTIEAWEKASRADPEFALAVPWIRAPRTPLDVYAELVNQVPCSALQTATDLARVVDACARSEHKKKER